MPSFKALHQQEELLVLTNVWDVASATIAQTQGAQALGTSSGALAATLGYTDGEGMPFEEMKYMVNRIAEHTTLPLSVDLEAGYGQTAQQIANNIQQLVALGVVGVNLEDSLLVNGNRVLQDALKFAEVLATVVQILEKQGVDVFINVRIDAFLLGQPKALAVTKDRIQAYEAAGANGIFLPCLTNEVTIEVLVACTSLPINLMAMPNLPNFEALNKLGVKRVSMGDFVFRDTQKSLENTLATIFQEQSFNSIF